MKLFKLLLSSLVFAISFVSNAAFADPCSLEHMIILKPSKDSRDGKVYLDYVSKNLDITWYETNKVGGHNLIFYSNAKLEGESINITAFVNEQLLSLGFIPKFYTYDSPEFDLSLIHDVDDFGNLLLTFVPEKINCNGSKEIEKCVRKIGVWNNNYGFKIINIDRIEQIEKTIIMNDYFIVQGKDSNNEECIAVFSIKDGYWGERIQPEPEPVIKESWWDKNKPTWWP